MSNNNNSRSLKKTACGKNSDGSKTHNQCFKTGIGVGIRIGSKKGVQRGVKLGEKIGKVKGREEGRKAQARRGKIALGLKTTYTKTNLMSRGKGELEAIAKRLGMGASQARRSTQQSLANYIMAQQKKGIKEKQLPLSRASVGKEVDRKIKTKKLNIENAKLIRMGKIRKVIKNRNKKIKELKSKKINASAERKKKIDILIKNLNKFNLEDKLELGKLKSL